MNFKELNAELLPQAEYHVYKWLPGGKRSGVQYAVKNPMRDDKSIGSFKINLETGKWKDFAHGEGGGDLIALYKYIFQCESMSAAAKEINQATCLIGDEIPKTVITSSNSEWEPLPYAEERPPRSLFYFKQKKHTDVWAYKTVDGRLAGCVARFDFADGKKDMIPFSFCINKSTGNKAWKMKGMKVPRPLYGLNKLAEKKNVTVIVEGEKCARAINKLNNKTLCATTWPAGAESVDRADWSPIVDMNVIIWPDNDEPGFKVTHHIYEKLKDKNKIKFVLPNKMPEKWDCYDLIETGGDAQEYIKENIGNIGAFMVMFRNKFPKNDVFKNESIIKDAENEPPDDNAPPPEIAPEDRGPMDINDIPSYFRFLGHDHGNYYFLPSGIQQVLSMKPSEIAINNICQLMPLQKWEKYFPSQKFGVNLKQVANYIIRTQERTGIYNADAVRGRGAWYDDQKIVLHLGDHLRVNDVTTALHKFQTKFIYEKAAILDVKNAPPLSVQQAHAFLKICKDLRWENDINGTLLAGWIVLSVVCGALKWRPHIWLTGSKGCGKSWIMRNIIKQVLGSLPLDVASNTSEAGIRQALGSDALPLLFDEAESKGIEGRRRLQNVLELLRQSSSSDGASIIKGSQTGKAQFFKIRTCGCLSSIGVGIEQKSDESRISVLALRSLVKPTKEQIEEFQKFEKEVFKFLSRETCAMFRSRAISLIPIIRKNVDIFSKVCSEAFGSQREGDQIGTLLAGAYSLTSQKLMNEDAARDWVAKQDWNRVGNDNNPLRDSDEIDCLNTILTSKIKYYEEGHMDDRLVIELVEQYTKLRPGTVNSFLIEHAELGKNISTTLSRNGIKINKDSIVISNSSTHIKKMLETTQFASKWGTILQRIKGADSVGSTRFFGITTRATRIPFSAFIDDGEDDEEEDDDSEYGHL